MKKIEEWIAKLNQQQKIILGIVIPVGLLIIFYPIADEVAIFNAEGYYSEPFSIEDTWLVWLIYVVIVGLMEFKLFENKK